MKKTFIIGGLFLSIELILGGCNIKLKSGKKVEGTMPDFIMGEFQYISVMNGKKEWLLKAEEAKMYNATHETYLFNLTMTFYNPNGEVQSFLSSDTGYVNRNTKNVQAEGHVQIFAENGTVMKANRVFWDNSRKKFYTQTNEIVTLEQGNTIIQGYEMLADSALKEVTFVDVVGTIQK